MSGSGVAFSPCQITGFFRIHNQFRDPARVGSTGVGVCIEDGVTTRVVLRNRGSGSIRLNGRPLARPAVSRNVLGRFRELIGPRVASIDHKCPLPVGCGYGTSGAGALSLSLALNDALGNPLSNTEAGMIAHVAEVEAKTGLGTVISEYTGGAVARTRPGGPGIGITRRIRFPSSVRIVSGTFGPFRKDRVLGSLKLSNRVNHCGHNLMSRFLRQPSSESFIDLSVGFSDCLSLYSRKLGKASRQISSEGIRPSMMMLGDSLFSIVPHESAKMASRAFAIAGFNPIVSRISPQGARVL